MITLRGAEFEEDGWAPYEPADDSGPSWGGHPEGWCFYGFPADDPDGGEFIGWFYEALIEEGMIFDDDELLALPVNLPELAEEWCHELLMEVAGAIEY